MVTETLASSTIPSRWCPVTPDAKDTASRLAREIMKSDSLLQSASKSLLAVRALAQYVIHLEKYGTPARLSFWQRLKWAFTNRVSDD